MPFEGTTAIVTGGASGIGLASPRRSPSAARRSPLRHPAGRPRHRGRTAPSRRRDRHRPSGRRVEPPADRDAVAAVREELGPILILVNSAGIEQFGKFSSIDDELWDHVMAINLRGPFMCSQAVLPDMKEAGWGRIVHISSSSTQSAASRSWRPTSARRPGSSGSPRAWRSSSGPDGITVNTIPPGMIVTPMVERADRRGALHRRLETLRQHHPGAPGRRAGRHRQRGDVPLHGRVVVHHRPGHRRQRRAQHVSDDSGAGHRRPLPPDEWGDDEYAAYGSLLGLPGEEVPRAGSGPPLRPDELLGRGHVRAPPGAGQGLLAFNSYQLQRSSLPAAWRELAILRVAHRRSPPTSGAST